MKYTNQIIMKKGESIRLKIQVTDVEGQAYILGDGEVLRFGIKRNMTDSNYVYVKNLTNTSYDEDEEAYIVELVPADTQDLNYGTYFYDAGVQSGVDYYYVLEPSEFIIAKRVTEWAGV